MDPDAALSELHTLLHIWHSRGPRSDSLDREGIAEQIVEQFEALDEWLSRGGCLPQGWRAR